MKNCVERRLQVPTKKFVALTAVDLIASRIPSRELMLPNGFRSWNKKQATRNALNEMDIDNADSNRYIITKRHKKK